MNYQTISAITLKLVCVCFIAYSSAVMADVCDQVCLRHCADGGGACGSFLFTDEDDNNCSCECEAACSSPQEYGSVLPE